MTTGSDEDNSLEPQRKSDLPRPENPWAEAFKTIGLAAVLAFGIRTFVAEARYIPSGSMEPTLHGSPNRWNADQIIVDKVSYHFQNPHRGDIVVFQPTDELQRQGFRDAFIKRIVGLPGESVELSAGKVIVNGTALRETYTYPSSVTSTDVCPPELQPYLSTPIQVPNDSYLVLGDNRESSYDGRCWGVVPRDRIIGQAKIRFWPPNRAGGLH